MIEIKNGRMIFFMHDAAFVKRDSRDRDFHAYIANWLVAVVQFVCIVEF